MTLSTSPAWWAWGAIALAILGLAWLAYRRARPALASWQHLALVALRATTLAAIVLVLLRPVRIEPRPESGGLVPVLVDASASMSLTDGGQRSRADLALEIVRSRVVPALQPHTVPQVYTFGERLAPLDPDATTIAAVARASRLGEALGELRDRLAGRRLAGVVVVSDGAVEVDAAATAAAAPVIAIPVGADALANDREVYGVSIGDARVQASLVDVTALVVVRGPSREPFDVTLSQNAQPVGVRRVTPSPDGAAARVVFRVAPARETATLYTVAAAAADGEWTTANNRQSVLAPPAGPQRRVLLVEGAPGHEHSFLKRSLEDDPGLTVDAIVRKGENDRGEATFYVQAAADRAPSLLTGFPATRAALFAYDAVLLANVDAAMLPASSLGLIAEFVAERGGGLVVLGARSFDAGGLARTLLSPLLPVEPGDRAGGAVRVARGPREPYRVALTEDGDRHPVMRLRATASETRVAWDAVPALASTAALGDPRPGASVLALTSSPGGVPRPLVAVQRYGRGRVLQFGGEASWRWRMMLASDDATYDTFWRQAIRWTGADAVGPVSVTATTAGGHRVRVVADVRDADFAPATDAQVRLRVADPAGRDADLAASRDQTTGLVSATFDAAVSGVHRVSVEARRGATPLGSGDAWVLVGGADTEFVDPRRVPDALRALATATGGRLAEPEGAADAVRRLGAAGTSPGELVQREAWHSPWTWLGVVLLLGAEWTLRRRWGLR